MLAGATMLIDIKENFEHQIKKSNRKSSDGMTTSAAENRFAREAIKKCRNALQHWHSSWQFGVK